MRAFGSALLGIWLLTPSLVAQQGTAGLTGKVKDITGAEVSVLKAELQSVTVSSRKFRATADSSGTYSFSGLPPDEYMLKLLSPGFSTLTVKSIHILECEQKSLRDLQLEVASMA